MKTEEDILTRRPENAPNADVKCLYCNDTGFYRLADCNDYLRFQDPDCYIPCPYCSTEEMEAEREITPPEPPYDPYPKASGYELQIFAIIGIIGLLVASIVGIVRSISLVQLGAIQTFFHADLKIGLALFAFALLLLTASVFWIVRVIRRRS